MKVSLNYDLLATSEKNYVHPQEQMRRLGIKYKKAIPQSVVDCWWFIDCEVEDINSLPKYLKVMEFTDKDREHWL